MFGDHSLHFRFMIWIHLNACDDSEMDERPKSSINVTYEA